MNVEQTPIPYSDDVESIPVDEASDIQRVVCAVRKLLERGTADSGKFRADVHVKTHGYANGQLNVLENLPTELSQGLFGKVQSFPVVVRFSNSANMVMPDSIPDGRGIAIKVRGVVGELIENGDQAESCQDFVLINHPVFFAANPKEMLRLEQFLVEVEAHPIAAASEALTGGDWNPLNWHWRELSKATQIVAKLPSHPASNTYFSMSPFRYGDYVAKFRLAPVDGHSKSYLTMLKRLATETDAMRLALEETLHSEPIKFELQVQLRTSSDTMPIENATHDWPEDDSPYRTVAQLVLPKQNIAPLREDVKYTNLSFDVWHALTAHRPLGGINRLRRHVYPVSAAWRRKSSV